MRKIRLDIDDLAVESFDTASRGKDAGTVRGHDDDGSDVSNCVTCVNGCPSEFSNCATCLNGCPGDTFTCFASCIYSQVEPYGPCEPYIGGSC